VESEAGLPVIRVPAGTPPITEAMVRRALDEDRVSERLHP
jgi:phospholipid N-methyltransferase